MLTTPPKRIYWQLGLRMVKQRVFRGFTHGLEAFLQLRRFKQGPFAWSNTFSISIKAVPSESLQVVSTLRALPIKPAIFRILSILVQRLRLGPAAAKAWKQ